MKELTFSDFEALTGFPLPSNRRSPKYKNTLLGWFKEFGHVTDDNGSEFHFRVDQYTLPNGATLTRYFGGWVDKARGITRGDRWVLELH